MKIAEAKEGKVRCVRAGIASGKMRIKARESGLKNTERQDFISHLSDRDKRLWERLPEAKKKKISKEADSDPAISRCDRIIEKQETSSEKPSGGSGRSSKRSSVLTRKARLKASKVSSAIKNLAGKIYPKESGGEISNHQADISGVTGKIRKIVAMLVSILAVVFGPVIFLLFILVFVVILVVLLVVWLVSAVVSALSGSGGSYFGNGIMPYYCQQDEAWANYPYDAGKISDYGCGPTSMAMIMACLTGDGSIDPTVIAKLGNDNIGRYGLSVNGTHSAPVNISEKYGVTDIEQMAGPSKNCCGVSKKYDLAYIKSKIAEGCPVLVSITGTYLNVNTEGHYIVLFGEGDNGVYVYDPGTNGRIHQESLEKGGDDWDSVLQSAKHIWIFPAVELAVTGDTNAQRIFNYLVSAGWSKAAAAGAVGNFYQEAGGGGTADINPASYSSGSWGESGGIAGFTDNGSAGNFTALKKFADSKGKDWTDLQVQCEFLVYQMTHGKWWGGHATPTYKQMLNSGYSIEQMTYQEFTQLTDVETATKAFLCFYEDCGMADAHYEDVRLPMAQQAYAAFGKSDTQGS